MSALGNLYQLSFPHCVSSLRLLNIEEPEVISFLQFSRNYFKQSGCNHIRDSAQSLTRKDSHILQLHYWLHYFGGFFSLPL